MDIRELKQKKARLLAQARALVDGASAQDRDLTEQEEKEYEQIMQQIDQVNSQIEQRQNMYIDMPPRELERYSIVRAIRAAADAARGVRGAWDSAGLEWEASQAVAQKLGRQPQGFFVPADVTEQRTLLAGGSPMVETEVMSIVDALRARLVVKRAGATVMTELAGNISIPRVASGATGYWVSEGNAVTKSTATIQQIAMTPKIAAGYTAYTRQLLAQSAVDVEAFVRQDLAAAIARQIDRAALHGTGTAPEPRGVANTTGVNVVAIGTNGGAPTWEHIVALESEIEMDNANDDSLAYITNPKVKAKLKTTPKFSAAPEPIWDEDVNGYPAYVTTLVRSDLTKGTGNNLSAIFFGNWSDLVIGLWGGLDVIVDPYTDAASGTVRVIAMEMVDIAVRHPQSFAVVLDAVA
mgnify:CR=1 FL=1